MEQYVVTIAQENGYIKLEFNKMSYALEFAERCLECGDAGTTITIKEKQED